MPDPCFFGYGSLVNLATHQYHAPEPARLTGWRRAWRHTPLRPVAFLTAEPAPGAEIEGMVARVPDGDWAALDAREWAYDRHSAAVRVGRDDREVAVYAVPTSQRLAPDARHPVLLSYLDVVLQGYLRAFGEPGADRFFDTTDGWDAPILNDRAQPRYPRHQKLAAGERAYVDRRLAALATVVELTDLGGPA